jgi:AcrR family transcriptional regulator
MPPATLDPNSTTTPRRRGRPRTIGAVVVREYAHLIRDGAVPVDRIARECGVHPATVYRWLKAS